MIINKNVLLCNKKKLKLHNFRHEKHREGKILVIDFTEKLIKTNFLTIVTEQIWKHPY